MRHSHTIFTLILLILLLIFHLINVSFNSTSENNNFLTVHIFINHNPYLASAFLPSLFNPSSFPNHLWNPPPSRHSSPKQNTTPRTSLAHYTFPIQLPPSTHLSEISTKLQNHFNIHKKYHAYYTIFPATNANQHGNRSAWYEQPLREETTLSEAHSRDPERSKESVELVLFTKAAALARISGTGFVEESLGSGAVPKRLGGYSDIYPAEEGFDVPAGVRRWRYALRAGRVLEGEKEALVRSGESGGEGGLELERQIEELRAMKLNAISEFRELVTQWQEWVLGIVDHDGVEITDENFEDKWEYLRRSRGELVEAWKVSERKADVLKGLRWRYLSSLDLWPYDSPDGEDEREAKWLAGKEQWWTGLQQQHFGNESDEQDKEVRPGSYSVISRSFRYVGGTLCCDH
ncbi:hypothetical protein BBP40_012032 [Aspergillus hancockii]|nr:hypothetical protein BBP40_012032 [Aspergillus hancockii]